MEQGNGPEELIDLTTPSEPFEVPAENMSSTSPDSEIDNSSSEDDIHSISSSSASDSEDEVTPEFLESLLEKARQNAIATSKRRSEREGDEEVEEDIINLETDSSSKPLLRLDPGILPPAYLIPGDSRSGERVLVRDPDAESAQQAASSKIAPEPPALPLDLGKSGRPLTKRQKKELKRRTAGPDWFDLPAPSESELPKLYREVEAMRLRNHLDPKRFYRKDDGEGKGIKGLPKYFAIGTIVPSGTPFGGPSSDNVPRSHRKRTLVEELVDDAEAKRYAKKKFDELQKVRGEKGKRTLAIKQAMRKPKW